MKKKRKHQGCSYRMISLPFCVVSLLPYVVLVHMHLYDTKLLERQHTLVLCYIELKKRHLLTQGVKSNSIADKNHQTLAFATELLVISLAGASDIADDHLQMSVLPNIYQFANLYHCICWIQNLPMLLALAKF